MKVETAAIQFEWKPPRSSKSKKEHPRLNASRCWNNGFWYGDGSVATERSVIIRRSDFLKLMKLARLGQTVECKHADT